MEPPSPPTQTTKTPEILLPHIYILSIYEAFQNTVWQKFKLKPSVKQGYFIRLVTPDVLQYTENVVSLA